MGFAFVVVGTSFVSFVAIDTFTWLMNVFRALPGGSLRGVSGQAGKGGGEAGESVDENST